MALSKKQRQEVWAKSNGVCWYCGEDLPEKGWHADHLVPIIRASKPVWNEQKRTYIYEPTGENHGIGKDEIDNIVPACAPCNLYKSAYPLEWFRNLIQEAANVSRKLTSGFRISERFGLIEVKDRPVVFWFERQD